MFSKLALFATVAVPLASALTLEIPSNPTSGGSVTIKWTSAANDPETFSFELVNTVFHNSFAISNNVNPTAEQLTLTLPIVPVGDGYSLEAVDVGNITNIFASTGDFAIGAATVSLSSSASTSSAASVSASGSSSAASVTASLTNTAPLSTSPALSSNVVSPSSTAPATSSISSALPSSSSFSGALSSHFSLGNSAGGIAAVFLSVVAGAAMLAF